MRNASEFLKNFSFFLKDAIFRGKSKGKEPDRDLGDYFRVIK
jgi:hypothetical protein